MSMPDNFEDFTVAPPSHWQTLREEPWLPGASDRLIFFYVSFDDPIDMSPNTRFYYGAGDIDSASASFIPISSAPYPPLDPLGLAFRFLAASQTNSIVATFASTADVLANVWPPNGHPLKRIVPRRLRRAWRDLRTINAGPDLQTRSTVVEIVFRDPGGIPAQALTNSDGQVFDYLSMALLRLNELVQGYRTAAYVPVRDASYMNLGPLVVTIEVDLVKAVRTPQLAHALESATRLDKSWSTRISGVDLVESVRQWADRIAIGDPIASYSTNIWTARRLCYVENYYEASVIHSAIAIEGYLPAVWLLLRWEMGDDAAKCMTELDRISSSRASFFDAMFGALSRLVGGHWDPINAPEIATWNRTVREVRNSIAHTGAKASRLEAETALESSRQLNLMVRDRILAKLRKYPRAAYLTAGVDGIDQYYKYGTWTRRYCSLQNEPTWYRQFSTWILAGRDQRSNVGVFTAAIDVCEPECSGH